MEQLSSFLHRGSFVPPFPPAWLSLAKGQRLLGSLRAKAQTFPKTLRGMGGGCLGLRKRPPPDARSWLPARLPGPRHFLLPGPPHPGNPIQAPTRGPQRKWSLSSAPKTNWPSHLLSLHLCSRSGLLPMLSWQFWMLCYPPQTTPQLVSLPTSPWFAILGLWTSKFRGANGF